MGQDGKWSNSLIIMVCVLAVAVGLSWIWVMGPKDDVSQEETKVRVALSQTDRNSPRLTEMLNSFEASAETNGMTFIYHEPESFSSEWQIEDVAGLLAEGIDYLILVPREEKIIGDILDMAGAYETPVILLSSQISDRTDFVTTISTDYIKEGMTCADILAEKYEGQICRVIEVTGVEGSSIAVERAYGFRLGMAKYTNLILVESVEGGANRIAAQKAMEDVIVSRPNKFEAVFAHNDEDGIGALNAMKVSGYLDTRDVDIVSVNGVQDVFKAIIAEEYLATVHSNAELGDVAFAIIGQMERDFKPTRMVVMPHAVIDASNAEDYLQLTY